METVHTLILIRQISCSCSSMRFFDFPPEIRNLIYKFLQPTGKIIKPIFTIGSQHHGRSVASFEFPAKVFGVSKVFDQEAATVFYSQNIFSFSTLFDSFCFMGRIGKIKSASLQYLEVSRFTGGAGKAHTLAENCPQLKRIEFGDVVCDGKHGNWSMSTLESIQAFALTLPRLSQISYISAAGRLRLATKDDRSKHVVKVPRWNKQGYNRHVGTPFDVDHEISELELRILERRRLATEKAQATKAANAATIARGGPAAQVLLAAKAERKRIREAKKAQAHAARATANS